METGDDAEGCSVRVMELAWASMTSKTSVGTEAIAAGGKSRLSRMRSSAASEKRD